MTESDKDWNTDQDCIPACPEKYMKGHSEVLSLGKQDLRYNPWA